MAGYGSDAGADTYHSDRGNAAWAAGASADRTAARIRASEAIDARYGSRFPGVPAGGRDQERAWPRKDADGNPVKDADGNEIPIDEVPWEVEFSTYEAALRELDEAGSMAPDLDRGGAVKRLKAGSVEVEYTDGAARRTTVTTIEGLLWKVFAFRGGDLLRV